MQLSLLKPVAGVPGTIILVEDLFHNMPTRRSALRSGSEEYKRILDIVTCYAVHHAPRGVGFTCKKHGSTCADACIPAGASSKAAIRLCYGDGVARELESMNLQVEIKGREGADAESRTGANGGVTDLEAVSASGNGCVTQLEHELRGFSVAVAGLFSNANWSQSRSHFIIFINRRLVECRPLKRAVEAVCECIHSPLSRW